MLDLFFADIDEDISYPLLNFIAVNQVLVGHREQDTESREKHINKVVRQVRGYIFAQSFHQPYQEFEGDGSKPAKEPDEDAAINQEISLAVLTDAPAGNFVRDALKHVKTREGEPGFLRVTAKMNYICP